MTLWLVLIFAADFRFVIVGDRTGTETPGVYRQIWREAAASRPAFAIAIGDVIQGDSDETVAAEWQETMAMLPPRLKVHFVEGNHDRQFERYVGSAAMRSFDYGGAHFTLLGDSPGDAFSESQQAFLEKDLAASKARLKFVFLHRPVWFTGLHPIVQKHGVRAVYSGHVHKYAHLVRDGIDYVLVGSSGGSLRGHDPRYNFESGWFYSHVVVDVKGGDVSMTVKETGPPFGRSRTLRLDRQTTAPVAQPVAPAAGRVTRR